MTPLISSHFAFLGSLYVCSGSGKSVVVEAGTSALMTWSTTVSTSSVVAGNAFSVQPVLLLTDAYEDAVAGKNVTLSLYTDSACTTLSTSATSGSLNTTDSNGLAYFTAFKTTVAGTYFVKAS